MIMVAFYVSAAFKVYGLTNFNVVACLWRMHGLLLDLMTLLGKGMTETSERSS